MSRKANDGIGNSGVVLRLCDRCCDNSGTLKEMIKSGGCTCDVCGWSCKCVGEECRQFINRVPVRLIPAEGWAWLQATNEASLLPLDWERLLTL